MNTSTDLSARYRRMAANSPLGLKDLYLDIADRAEEHGILAECLDCPNTCKQAGSGCPTVLICEKQGNMA